VKVKKKYTFHNAKILWLSALVVNVKFIISKDRI